MVPNVVHDMIFACFGDFGKGEMGWRLASGSRGEAMER